MSAKTDSRLAVDSQNDIRWYEFHRWLNPFAKQRTRMWTPLPPDEIEAALRPHIFRFRSSPLPHEGLYGGLKPWGFVLRQESFGEPRLVARYDERSTGVWLKLQVSRTTPGLFRWALSVLIWPLTSVFWILCLLASGAFGSLLSLLFDGHWITGEPIPGQPAILLIMTPIALYWSARAIANNYKRRDEIDFYQRFLAETIDARRR